MRKKKDFQLNNSIKEKIIENVEYSKDNNVLFLRLYIMIDNEPQLIIFFLEIVDEICDFVDRFVFDDPQFHKQD